MEIHRKYDQIIYNICQLIRKHKYKRAIATAQHLQAMGFAHHQVLVLKSYATAKLEGYRKALQILHLQTGPLVQMAKAQYNQHLSQFQQAQVCFDKLVVQGKPAIIDLLAKSNQICFRGEGELERQVDSNKVRLVSNKRQEECVQAMNKITQSYVLSKSGKEKEEISGQQFIRDCKAYLQQYQSILQEYRPKKELKIAIQHFIVFLSNI